MFKDLQRINKAFSKGFRAVYYAKNHCPVCKEPIFANALVCPYCKTDFRNEPQRKTWQTLALKIIFAGSILIAVSMYLDGIHLVLDLMVLCTVYAIGYLIVQKIQSFKNYHQKK